VGLLLGSTLGVSVGGVFGLESIAKQFEDGEVWAWWSVGLGTSA
jgi:hypothetical protein